MSCERSEDLAALQEQRNGHPPSQTCQYAHTQIPSNDLVSKLGGATPQFSIQRLTPCAARSSATGQVNGGC